MNCSGARLAIGAEPHGTSPALEAHLRDCPACREFRRETQLLDGRIKQALELDLASFAKPRTTARPTPRRWALAATLLVAVGAGLLLWSTRPTESLAAQVIEHVEHEPGSWSSTAAVPQSAVAFALRGAGVRLTLAPEDIVYAQSCWFRGRYVPHFVIQTVRGPMTVLILPRERIRETERFSEGEYTGVLLPAQTGGIAVLGKRTADVEQPALEILHALRWEGPAPH